MSVSHGFMVAFPWCAFVRHPQGEGKCGKVNLIHSFCLMWEHMDECRVNMESEVN